MTTHTRKQPQPVEREMRDDGRVSKRPSCCAEPSVRPALEHARRNASGDRAAAAGDPSALAHAETGQAEWMLELSEPVAERRHERLECRIGCLEAKIEAPRVDARRAPQAPKAGGGRQGYVEPRTHAKPQRTTRPSGERAR